MSTKTSKKKISGDIATAVSPKLQRFVWCLYDFANSSFPTVIVTAVYVIYFKKVVVGNSNPGLSDNLWGLGNSIAALLVLIIAPVMGVIADHFEIKKHFFTGFTLLCVLATSALCFTGNGTIVLAITLFVIAVIGFESAVVFYNAFLPSLADKKDIGRLSGNGWAMGYIGGLLCLLVSIPLTSSHIKLVPVLVALWYLIFSLPSFFCLKTPALKRGKKDFSNLKVVKSLKKIGKIYKELLENKVLSRFLLSYFFYNNAIVTVIVFAVAFSTDTLHFSTKESILLVVTMNVVASPAAFMFGIWADKFGGRRMLLICLAMWLLVVAGAEGAAWPGLFNEDIARAVFWGVSVLASLCIGASQSISRTIVGKLAPDGEFSRTFGFMAFAGKGSAVLGPLVFGMVSDVFNSQRLAVATIGFFFAVGLILFLRVPKKELR